MAGRFEVKTVFKGKDETSKSIRSIGRSTDRFSNKSKSNIRSVGRDIDGLGSRFAGLKTTILGVAATIGGKAVVGKFMEIEDAQAAFTPILRSAEKAREAVERLKVVGKETPFEFGQLVGPTKTLLTAFNGDLDQTVETMKRLGDMTGGNADALFWLSTGFQRMKAQGRLLGAEVNFFEDRSIPILKEIGKVMGTDNIAVIKKAISAGRVEFAVLEKAIKNMTKEGGMFFQGMEIQSKTLSGRFSTLKDSAGDFAATLGEQIAPKLKGYVEDVIKIIDKTNEWAKANKAVVQMILSFPFKVLEESFKFYKGIVDSILSGIEKIKSFTSGITIERLDEINEHPLEALWKLGKWMFGSNEGVNAAPPLSPELRFANAVRDQQSRLEILLTAGQNTSATVQDGQLPEYLNVIMTGD
jgi:phage tail tape-measure protein